MNIKFHRIMEQMVPYVILGFTLAFAIGLFIMFSYLLLWGLAIGLVLYVGVLIKNYFFPKHPLPAQKSKGRVIEHEKKD